LASHSLPLAEPGSRRLVLVGQPNVGKSVVFSRLTGRYVTCSNYPGTTVEVFRGETELEGERWTVIDTPGVVDLASAREDEGVTRDLLLGGGADVVLQVADAKNLERSLMLWLQLAELGIPMVLLLNMADEQRARGIEPPAAALARRLGVPVVSSVATRGEGMDALRDAVATAAVPIIAPEIGGVVDAACERLAAALATTLPELQSPALAARLAMAVPANGALAWLDAHGLPESERDAIAGMLSPRGRGAEIAAITDGRMRGILRDIDADLATTSARTRRDWSRDLGRWTLHPVWGSAILIAVVAALYLFVGQLGAVVLVGWIEEDLFGGLINPALTRAVEAAVPIPLVRELLVGEYGLVTMALTYSIALILPVVSTFFLAFGVLEDSGYFPRLSVMASRVFARMGLSGQAVLPMILGLSCDTMATVTTRVLETRKERVIATLLLALGVPCSAQLAVMLAMSAAISPWVTGAVAVVVIMQLFIVGRLASRLLPGRTTPFIAELPPLRWPRLGNVLAKTRMRLLWYLTEVVPLFVLGTLVLFGLHSFGILAAIGEASRPVVVGWLGLPADASDAFVMGFFRRDYGAAGLYQLQRAGGLDSVQMLVSLVVITLFVPCVANLLVMVKERGWKTAIAIVAFIIPYALLVGTVVNAVTRAILGS
jgi:ferrous iron transport protein B